MLMFFMEYSSILKMDATIFSEMSIGFKRIALLCIPEDRILPFLWKLKEHSPVW
jgi:hypothetical protein